MWTDDYVGIPFRKDGHDRTGIDCWRLVVLIYGERRGIELPSYRGIFQDRSLESLRAVTRQMREEQKKWERVLIPRLFDIVQLRAEEYHVGVVINRTRMIHILEGIDSMIEDYTGIHWRNRIEGFFRYAG